MAVLLEPEEHLSPPATAPERAAPGGTRVPSLLQGWLEIQAVNVNRHAQALRPFQRDEFGRQASSPSEGRIQAVNTLLGTLRTELLKHTGEVSEAVDGA